MTGKMSDQFCNVSRDNSCRLRAALNEENGRLPSPCSRTKQILSKLQPSAPLQFSKLTDASEQFGLEDMKSLEIANNEAYSSLGTKQSQASDPTHQHAALF
ncbi:predicted protein [Histoplasma capsulatum var. duboisii H88]|uniref:Predicted protein n=1 Tax=Ajellomyces capsulatus (strain H88) TaxID=544711 RepID=F0UB82_AJEC8|nr:predicted protein [Histoplasma capsulatum var. duboisii H88]